MSSRVICFFWARVKKGMKNSTKKKFLMCTFLQVNVMDIAYRVYAFPGSQVHELSFRVREVMGYGRLGHLSVFILSSYTIHTPSIHHLYTIYASGIVQQGRMNQG